MNATKPKPPTPPPIKREGLPRDLEIRLDKATRWAMRAKTNEEREKAASAKAAVLEEAARRIDNAYLDGARKELDGLERLRGGQVIVEDVVTDEPVLNPDGSQAFRRGRKLTKRVRAHRPRLTNRDGLETLLTAKALNAIQYVALMKYRGMYEDHDALKGLTPPDPNRAGGGGGPRALIDPNTATVVDFDGIGKVRASAIKAKELQNAEKRVYETCPADALATLRAVAGHGVSIYRLSGGGSRRRAIKLTSALVDAADALADHWGLQ